MAAWCRGMLAHDDVIKWKHFPRYWPFVRGIHRSPVNSPHKGQWRRALMFSLICVWRNGWVNNCEAGYLTRYRAHYHVTVMHWVFEVFYKNLSPFIKQSLSQLTPILLGNIHPIYPMPQFVINVFYGVAIRRLRWLLHLGDALLLEKGGDYSGTMRHSVIVLITKVILEILPHKWLQCILQDFPILYSIRMCV